MSINKIVDNNFDCIHFTLFNLILIPGYKLGYESTRKINNKN